MVLVSAAIAAVGVGVEGAQCEGSLLRPLHLIVKPELLVASFLSLG